MEEFIYYLGKSAIACGAFYICFLLLFQRQKHFGFNRYYLLASLAISYLIPFITFTIIKEVEPQVSNFVAPQSFNFEMDTYITPQVTIANSYSWYHYTILAYVVGIIGLCFHLAIGYIKASSIIRKSKKQQLFGCEVYVTSEDIHPFSFFNKTVISEKTINHQNLQMIIEHEKTHADEKHTIDILLGELLFLFQWFNPFAWLMKDAIKNNLEYKTDCKITESADRQTYQLAMVSLADKKGVAPFLNALNGSQLKNRIIMMKKQTHNKYAILRQIVIIPLLIILVTTLSGREYRYITIETKKHPVVVIDGNVIPRDDIRLKDFDFYNGFDANDVLKALKIDKENIEHSDFIDGKLNPYYGYDSEDGVLLFKSKDYKEGAHDRFDVLLFYSEESLKRIKPLVADTIYNIKSNPLFIVDNEIKEYPDDIYEYYETKEIATVAILRGQNAIDEYGDRAINGVILIETKKDSFLNNSFAVKNLISGIITEKQTGKPLPGVMITISGQKLGKMSGMDGRYSIETEKPDGIISFSRHNMKDILVDIDNRNTIDIVMEEDPDKKSDRLVLLDGKKISMEELNLLEVNNYDTIQSISILNNQSAKELYGEEAKNGVVLISTKNNQSDLKDRIINEVSSEEIYISGIVTDEKGNPISLAMVKYGEGFLSKATDVTGFYKIAIDELKGKLTFRKMGWKSREIEINGQNEINVALQPDPEFIAPNLSSGEFTVYGKVISAETKEPIFNVEIHSLRYGIKVGTTDKNGEFTFKSNVGRAAFTFMHSGYEVENVVIKFEDSDSYEHTLTVEMKKGSPWPTQEPAYVLNGKIIDRKTFNAISPDQLKSVEVKKEDMSSVYGEKAKNGVFIITLKGENYIPPLYIMDGKEMGRFDNIRNLINIEDVKSYKFLPPKEATEKYGNKGEQGAVIIKSKNAPETKDESSIIIDESVKDKTTCISIPGEKNITDTIPKRFRVLMDFATGEYIIHDNKPDNPKPIYVIDGQIRSEKDFYSLCSNEIDKITVLEGKAAIAAFGKKGENGVVNIETKKGNSKPVGSSYLEKNSNNLNNTNKEYDSIADENKKLFIVNGVEVGYAIKPSDVVKSENVKSISVMKGSSATGIYGEKAKNGVIEIETKPDNWEPPLLYIINGKTFPFKGTLAELNYQYIRPKKIYCAKMLQPEEAVKRYGEIGRNGVGLVDVYDSEEEPPLYFLDGKEMGRFMDIRDLVDIITTQIAFVDRIPRVLAMEEYGDKGKYGVVLISTDMEGKNIRNMKPEEYNPNFYRRKFNITTDSETGKYNLIKTEEVPDPLFMIDKKIVTREQFENVNSNDVSEIEILEPKDAPTYYGEQGKNGVILIKLKG